MSAPGTHSQVRKVRCTSCGRKGTVRIAVETCPDCGGHVVALKYGSQRKGARRGR